MPVQVHADAVWKRQDYRLSSFLADSAWEDVDRLVAHPATREVAGQLYRALGAIPGDISEGFSRSSPADRVRFLEYALGSARESRDRYQRALPVLGADRVAARTALITSVMRLVLAAITSERRGNTPVGIKRTR